MSANDKNSLVGKCVCPKHRAGRNCEKPNLCIDRCLNGGLCRWSDDGSSVACICRRGFKGERCQVAVLMNLHFLDGKISDKLHPKMVLTIINKILDLWTPKTIKSRVFVHVY
jgi:hypothetical protein